MALSPRRYAAVEAELQRMYAYLTDLACEVIATRGRESLAGHAHSATSAAAWTLLSLRQALALEQEYARQGKVVQYQWVGGQQDDELEQVA